MKTRGFQDVEQFESTKTQFIEVISMVYSHPKRLINAQLKDGKTDVVILTFYIMDDSQKYPLLVEMLFCSLQMQINDSCYLMSRLNIQLENSTVLNYQTIIGISEPVYTNESGKLILRKQFQRINFSVLVSKFYHIIQVCKEIFNHFINFSW